MTENPFGGSAGGFDMNALLQQAQEMQAQLADAQKGLAESTVSGTAGGGAVTVEITGLGELTKVEIRPGDFDASDAEDLADLGEVIVAAYRDARASAEAAAQQAMGPLTGGGGFGIPGLG